jgi:2-keto-4-pentenoate hydratase/2-oxohepta-3-ene-1,7-dioic acid hydratase in catechol pathway
MDKPRQSFRCLHLYLELDNPSPLRYQSTLISASNYSDDVGVPEPVESLPQLQVNAQQTEQNSSENAPRLLRWIRALKRENKTFKSEDSMRLVTFLRKNQQRIGLMGPQEQVIDLSEINRRYLKGGNPPFLASMQAFIEAGPKALQVARKAEKYVAAKSPDELKKLLQTGALLKPSQTKLMSPIPKPNKNVVMLGVNYREHVDEGAKARSLEIKYPEWPVFFTKPATSVIGHLGKVIHHRATDRLDWEVELAVIMGRRGRDIPKDKAYDYVFGYTVCLDMTARDLQRKHGQWFKGKSLDTFCPIGPWIVHKSALPDPQQVRLICRVNGEVMQDGNTRDMIFDIPTTIESLSSGMTLEPGDIISTGTPSGVGFARTPPVFLKPGDKVEGEVEGVGTLRVEIAEA